MSLHKLAKLTGFIFILIGVLGFIPGVTEDGMLLGTFHVNTAHNLVHILTGLIAIGMSRKDQKYTRYFFQIAGLFYLAVALLGFAHGDEPVLGILANNRADSWLHLLLSIAFLYIGFLYQNRRIKR